MRTALKLLLAALTATLAIGLAATSATAQIIHVEPEDEPGVCDPCPIHATSTGSLNHPTTEFEVNIPGHTVFTQCTDEFEGEIYEDGTGHITNQILAGPQCTRQACDSTEEEEWPFHLVEVSPGVEFIEVRLCLEPISGGDEFHCNLSLPIADEGDHHYVIEATEEHCPNPAGPEVRISAEWEIEHGHPLADPDHQPIEITHL
jgi:hypothetical protein